uniref:Uncharacterized protein n=1 Tax=Arundo donax TaxID=35708 RepID=A0A0A9CY17_ARUDO
MTWGLEAAPGPCQDRVEEEELIAVLVASHSLPATLLAADLRQDVLQLGTQLGALPPLPSGLSRDPLKPLTRPELCDFRGLLNAEL